MTSVFCEAPCSHDVEEVSVVNPNFGGFVLWQAKVVEVSSKVDTLLNVVMRATSSALVEE